LKKAMPAITVFEASWGQAPNGQTEQGAIKNVRVSATPEITLNGSPGSHDLIIIGQPQVKNGVFDQF
jgi:hypothetical protein